MMREERFRCFYCFCCSPVLSLIIFIVLESLALRFQLTDYHSNINALLCTRHLSTVDASLSTNQFSQQKYQLNEGCVS